MKKIIPLLTLLTAIVLVSFVPFGYPVPPAGRSVPQSRQSARAGDWVVVENSSCKILFPKTPSAETQTVNTAIGELKLDNHTYEVPDGVEDDNLLYLLSETEFSDSNKINSKNSKEQVDKFFRGSVDGAVNSVHGKLLTEEIIQLDGYPGRKFRVDVKDGMAVMTMRAYLVRNKMYMIQTITETKKDLNKSIDRFMDSFKLKH